MVHFAGHGLFLGAAVVGVALVLITEGLSLGARLTPGWLAASWALAGAVAVWAYRWRRINPPLPVPAGSMPRTARWAIGVILALTGAVALLSPPNTWDAMTYHMPRVAHWGQAGSVAHYPTHVLRQLWLGPGAEFAITHLYLLTGGDRLANVVQWLAFAGSVLGSAIVAAELGGGPRARALAAIACATPPMAIAQASSTQNDLVASFWMLALGYWVLRFRASPSVATAALVGVSAGLAGLTKLPLGFVAAPWLLAFGAGAGRLGRRRAIRCVAVAGLSAAALNLGHVSRTVPLLSGDPPSRDAVPAAGADVLPPVFSLYINTTADPRALASNVLRNAALHVVTPSDRVNRWLETAIVAAHRAMGFDPNDSRTTLGLGFPAFGVGPFRIHEDFVGNPLHLAAALAAGVVVWRRRQAFGAPARLWALMSAAAAIAFCAALKWQPWNSRLHLPLFVLASPLIGLALERRHRLAVLCAIGFCVLALPSLAVTWPRPLVGPGSVITMPRDVQRFRNHPGLQPAYEAAAGVVGDMGCRRVGLILGWDGWEYPFWALLRARLGPGLGIEHVRVENASRRFARPAAGAPCAVLVLEPGLEGPVAWQGRAFVERWRSGPVRVYGPGPDTLDRSLPPASLRKVEAVEPHGVVVEELVPVRVREIPRDRLEARVDGVEGRDKPVHRVVRGEHRAVDAEELDRA
jgi:hypothetical protein